MSGYGGLMMALILPRLAGVQLPVWLLVAGTAFLRTHRRVWPETLTVAAGLFSAVALADAGRGAALRLAGDLLLAESWKGRLLALELQTGKLRWELRPGQVHGVQSNETQLFARINLPEPENRWVVVAMDRATGKLAWELRARRIVPDLTLLGDTLVVELRNQVLALAV